MRRRARFGIGARQCDLLHARARKCLPSKKSQTSPCGTRPGDPRPLANERGIRTFSSTFENSTRPFALRSSRVLQGRMRFYDFCRECFNEHGQGLHEHPRSTIVMLGRLPFPIHRYLWIEDNHRGYARSGAEDHRIPAFPFGIAPERDFAPTSIASDSSCREAHSSALCGDT